MSRPRQLCIVVASSAVLAVAAGCTGADDPASPDVPSSRTGAAIEVPSPSGGSPSTGGSAGSTGSAGVATDDELGTVTPPPFPADTGEDTQAAVSGSGLVFTDLRIGRQDGFDRVVWEFAGGGEPGWLARYEDTPARQGSGDPVDLPGDATLLVLIDGVTIVDNLATPNPGITPYPGNSTTVESAGDTQHVTGVAPGAWFEGYQDGFVGVDSERPFRVYRLTDPPRVVLEVRD